MRTPLICLVALAALGAACDHLDSDLPPVNSVLGDSSFVAAFHRAPTADDSEITRIQTHLAFVETMLRERDTSGLSDSQRTARATALDRLARYREAARFPTNTSIPGRVPVFIDGDGAICAVGYLVEQSAGRDAAEAIAESHRYELVANMTLPLVDEWAEANGFTRRELAMIQPTYNGPPWEPPPEPPIVPGPPPTHPPGVPIPLPPRPPAPAPPAPPAPVPPSPVAPVIHSNEPTVIEIARMFRHGSFTAARSAFRGLGEELGGCWPEDERDATVTLRFSIAPSGSTDSVSVVRSSGQNDALRSCVVEAVEGMTFPRFEGLSGDTVLYRLDYMTSLTGWPAPHPNATLDRRPGWPAFERPSPPRTTEEDGAVLWE